MKRADLKVGMEVAVASEVNWQPYHTSTAPLRARVVDIGFWDALTYRYGGSDRPKVNYSLEDGRKFKTAGWVKRPTAKAGQCVIVELLDAKGKPLFAQNEGLQLTRLTSIRGEYAEVHPAWVKQRKAIEQGRRENKEAKDRQEEHKVAVLTKVGEVLGKAETWGPNAARYGSHPTVVHLQVSDLEVLLAKIEAKS